MAGMGTVTTFEWRGRRRGEDVAVAGPRAMTRVAKWAGVAAAGVLAGATLAHAADSSAYAQLLAAHVKPGTINGIRLNVVDYRAIGRDSNYAKSLQEIATARPEQLRSQEERLVFWINAYNLLAIKAVLDQYPAKSIKDGGSLFQSIWKKKVGTVAGMEYALDDIENGILRKDFREPRIHFAIVCASLSCPDLRAEPYTADRLDAQLDEAARAFLANPAKGSVPGPDGKTAKVSSIFKWFGDDFGVVGGVSKFILTKADPGGAARIAGLTDAGLSYLEYDWSLNDDARFR